MSNLVFIGPAEFKDDVKERPASAAILPRTVMTQTAGKFGPAAAKVTGVVYIADKQIHGMIDEAYAENETVQGFRPSSGEYYDLILAPSQTIDEDEALTTNAAGQVLALAASEAPLCYAEQAVTTTTAAGVIRVYFK